MCDKRAVTPALNLDAPKKFDLAYVCQQEPALIKTNRRNRSKTVAGLQKERVGSTGLEKEPTGIPGFDEIAGGGLPAGRPALICGSAGAGKTLFAVEFLVRGATLYNEPGVFMSFEETSQELATNVASLGFDLQ